MQYTLEVCAASMQSVAAAAAGGAHRIELCSALSLDGLTPSMGMIRTVKERFPQLTLHVLIRPREGNFVYNDVELATMQSDTRRRHRPGGYAAPNGGSRHAARHLPSCLRCLPPSRRSLRTDHRTWLSPHPHIGPAAHSRAGHPPTPPSEPAGRRPHHPDAWWWRQCHECPAHPPADRLHRDSRISLLIAAQRSEGHQPAEGASHPRSPVIAP